MPSFKRSSSNKKQRPKRVFVRQKKHITHKKAPALQKETRVDTAAQRQPPVPSEPVITEAPTTPSEVERLIHHQSETRHEEGERRADQAHIATALEDTPTEFNGVSSQKEEITLIQAELLSEKKKTAQLMHQIAIIKDEFEKERDVFERKIREMKRDLHRSQPLHEHTFFTLSKELQESAKMMAELMNDQAKPAGTAMVQAQAITPPPIAPAQMVSETKTAQTEPEGQAPKETDNEVETKKVVQKGVDATPEAVAKSRRKKKKTLLTGSAVAIIGLFIIGSLITERFFQPQVNDELVQEYLATQGEVAGVSDAPTPGEPSPGSTETRKSDPVPESEVPLEQTIWTNLNDPVIGVAFDYPQNVVKINKTDSSITLLRKDGYLFKVQKVETGLTLDEYWQQVKATNLNYSDEKTKFKEKEAIALSLQEMTPYPGDRFLVKHGEAIYDIWYATISDAFSKDDIARVKRTLESLTFKENE